MTTGHEPTGREPEPGERVATEPSKELVSFYDVAVVTGVEAKAVLESFATSIEAERVPAWIARTAEFIEWLGVFKRFLEGRVLTDPEVQKILAGVWIDPDTKKPYEWSGTHSRGWTNIASTVEQLFAEGLSTRSILEAISEIRVTDLRLAAERVTDAERKKKILEIIEDGRGETSGPKHLREIR